MLQLSQPPLVAGYKLAMLLGGEEALAVVGGAGAAAGQSAQGCADCAALLPPCATPTADIVEGRLLPAAQGAGLLLLALQELPACGRQLGCLRQLLVVATEAGPARGRCWLQAGGAASPGRPPLRVLCHLLPCPVAAWRPCLPGCLAAWGAVMRSSSAARSLTALSVHHAECGQAQDMRLGLARSPPPPCRGRSLRRWGGPPLLSPLPPPRPLQMLRSRLGHGCNSRLLLSPCGSCVPAVRRAGLGFVLRPVGQGGRSGTEVAQQHRYASAAAADVKLQPQEPALLRSCFRTATARLRLVLWPAKQEGRAGADVAKEQRTPVPLAAAS